MLKDKSVSPKTRAKLREVVEQDEIPMKTRILVSLFRHKEMLKKDILKKRALLERELQSEIQVNNTNKRLK